jgi:predicted Zn-ribbon and HTH transcriptional regulator
MEGRGRGAPRPPYGGPRQGRFFGDYGPSNDQRPFVRPWEDRRGGYRGGRPPYQHWRQREQERVQNQQNPRDQQFDPRQNLNQGREEKVQEEGNLPLQQVREEGKTSGKHEGQEDDSVASDRGMDKKKMEEKGTEENLTPGICKRCGKIGHKSEDCFRPLVCARCKKEGHVPRACSEIAPWECIAPFCGLAAPDLGFHIIQEDEPGDTVKDNSNYALITIKQGEASARQVEAEFKAQAGQNSTWRWYAKKIAENKFQMKFPTTKKVEELAFFSGMLMGTVPVSLSRWSPGIHMLEPRQKLKQPGSEFLDFQWKKDLRKESAMWPPWWEFLWK